jgi:hypothetical protein
MERKKERKKENKKKDRKKERKNQNNSKDREDISNYTTKKERIRLIPNRDTQTNRHELDIFVIRQLNCKLIIIALITFSAAAAAASPKKGIKG